MKPRRDITLGEMQDECKRFTDGLCGGKSCAYHDLCDQMKSGCTPHAWDLTNPPRFTEAQMAFLEQSYKGGVRKLESVHSGDAHMRLENGMIIGVLYEGFLKIEHGETLDLAELLGKDAT